MSKTNQNGILIVGLRQNGETHKAVIACNDYLRMGAGRSLSKLTQKYQESNTKAPSKSFETIAKWSRRFGWVARAEQYDQQIEEQKTAYAQEMMRSGLALDYERVDKLKELFDLLYDELKEKSIDGVLHNLWVPDVKSVGSGEFAERVDIERYNSAIISDIRGLLDDLAKETGGRTQKKDITSGGDKIEIVFSGNIDPDRI